MSNTLYKNEQTIPYLIVSAYARLKCYFVSKKKQFQKSLKKTRYKKGTAKATRKLSQTFDVPEETVKAVLHKLSVFETKQQFTSATLSLASLAKKLNTNSKYLSKIINHYYQKNFSSYINDLRIHYAINRLKNDRLFRKYSMQSIAEEVGFKSGKSFSKAFQKITNNYPSCFIKELNKWEEE